MPPAIPDIKLYHIVHMERLASILRDGCLLSDAALQVRTKGRSDSGIGYDHIKARRLNEISVPCCDNRMVGTFVPFYFCPRSPMLYTVNKGATGYPPGCQSQIVHLVTSITTAADIADEWAFSDGNAGAFHANFYNNFDDLGELDWDAIRAVDWRGRTHRKAAEFLVADAFPWESIEEIGCMNSTAMRSLMALATKHDIEVALPPVSVKPAGMSQDSWYYP